MQRPNQAINLAELKAQLVKRLGPDRSKLYFCYLNKLLNLELSKDEFNKLCLRVLGRENVRLHNKLIQSILRNACRVKVCPSPSNRVVENGVGIRSDGYERNGDALLTKSGVSFVSDGEFSTRQSIVTSSNGVLENRDLGSPEICKLGKQHQVLSKQTNNDRDELYTRCSLQPPLGIPGMRTGHQPPCVVRGDSCCSSYDSGRLLDIATLNNRIQEVAVARGLEGVSTECATLLNNGLDAYLKRLIRSSIELARTRSRPDMVENTGYNHNSLAKLINGGFQGYEFPAAQSNRKPLEGMQGHGFRLSLLDFKVAMGLKPQQLGANWPLLLERICTCLHDE